MGKTGVKVMALVCLFLLTGSCSMPMVQEEPVTSETMELTVVVPTDVKPILSLLIPTYEAQRKDVSVKLISAGSTPEDIHRFCVSILMDEKFKADLLIIDDFYLPEFAEQGFAAELGELNGDAFIPAAERSMYWRGKIYGAPLYGDALAEFRQFGAEGGEEIYLLGSSVDRSAFLCSRMREGLSAAEALAALRKVRQSGSMEEALESGAGVIHGWLSEYDALQRHHAATARGMQIQLSPSGLMRTRMAMVSAKSDRKEAAVDLIRYLLDDTAQMTLRSTISAVPVFRERYGIPATRDYWPYLSGMDGTEFSTLPLSTRYYEAERALDQQLSSGAPDEAVIRAMEYLAAADEGEPSSYNET